MKKNKVRIQKLQIKKETIAILQHSEQVRGGTGPSVPTWCCPTTGDICDAVSAVTRSFITACKSCPGNGGMQ